MEGHAMTNLAKRGTIENSGKIEKILEGAMALQGQGMIKEAENIYRKVLQKVPGHPGTLRLMAILSLQSGRSAEDSIAYLHQALESDPDFALAHNSLGWLLTQEKRVDEAIFHFSEAARLNGQDIECRLEMARLLDEEGEGDEAIEIYREVIEINPDDPRAHRGLGKILATRQDDEGRAEAAAAMHKAMELAPKDFITAYHAGKIFDALSLIDDAISAYERALELNPDSCDAVFALGNLMRDKGETQRAVDYLSRAIELNPKFAAAYSNLGNVLVDAGMFDEAIACANVATNLNPELGEAYNNLGAALQNACRPDEAIDAYGKALSLRPEGDATLWNLALCLLGCGHIEDGWDLYGYGFASGERKPYRPFPGMIWEGEDLSDKTIMITREQGLGDDLRFSTCFHDIIAEAKHVIIETNERLVPLYQRTWPQATVRKETGRATGLLNYPSDEIDFDVTAPAGIIAAHRRRSIHDFPLESRPLVTDTSMRAAARQWLDSLGSGPKVGLTWRSGLRTPLRNVMATAPADWACIEKINGAKLINLQFGEPDNEILEVAEKHGLTIHQMPGLDTHNNLDGTAALTAELDFVVGLWNAATEMAGALGIPGVIYMPARHSMQLGTGILPWHPSLRTYSVTPGFDGKSLAEAIANDATQMLQARR